jgi:hydroxyacylglutathione hydrolase
MIKEFTFNHFGENTYVVYAQDKSCVLIDVGCINKQEEEELYGFIEQNKLIVKHLLLTHAHIDHFFGMKNASKRYNLPITMSEEGMNMMNISVGQADIMGFEQIELSDVEKTYINYGDKIEITKDYVLNTFDVSGHCKGSIAYYSEKDNAVFVGDAVFKQSIGRTDFPSGDLDELLINIRKNILTLPYSTNILCGHGPNTTVDFEMNNNPYLQEIK